MAPSHTPNVIAVLDSRSECEVVLKTLQDPLYKVRSTCAMPPDFMERFVSATHAEPATHDGYGASQPVATGEWRKQPEFPVTEEDAPLICLAATRKLRELPPGARLLTRQGRAARRMLQAVAEYSAGI